MARQKNPFTHLILIVIAVVGGLVGYTYYQTGRVHIWPSLVGEQDPTLARHEKEIRMNVKRIGKLKSQLAMSMGGALQDEVKQEILDLEDRNLELQIMIDRLR